MHDESYPTAPEFARLLQTTQLDWILENHVLAGLPYHFFDNPELYQKMVRVLARDLNVDEEDISVVGSARIGFSLAPDKFGQPFGAYSDIDVIVVSPALFDPSWIDIVTNRHSRWSTLRPKTRERLKAHQSYHYIYQGWIYPMSVFEALAIGERWFNAFNGLSKIPELSNRKMNARLYRTWDHARYYHRRGLSQIKRKLEREQYYTGITHETLCN